MAEEVASTDPWAVVRRLQDRRGYLRVVRTPRPGRVGGSRPDPATGLSRSAYLLTGSPSSVIRTSTHYPDPHHVHLYLKHSCDVTMRGGLASAVTYPLAVCHLAEHYVLRRIGGASAGAAVAALTAAAELGRGAPDRTEPVGPLTVVPGFAGLAQLTGWLAGDGVPDGEERWRLTRLFQPGGGTRSLFRLCAALLRGPYLEGRRRWLAPVAAVLGGLGRQSKAVLALVWVGFAFGGLGLVTSQVRAAQATPDASLALALVTALALVVALGMAALLGSLLVYVLATAQFVRTHAEQQYFGLVPGVRRPGMARDGHGWRARMSARLDRWAGVPDAGDLPPLVEWLADRIDDLAGVPVGVDVLDGVSRRALTFGDLWLGELTSRDDADVARLAAMAADGEQRAIDLALVATNLSQRRPVRLPFPAPDLADRIGTPRLLFCTTCLDGVLPPRVVAQMVAASPAVEKEHTCPRHPEAGSGGLLELPDPWDLPVVAAARLSLATPGLLRALPLYTVEPPPVPSATDEWGAPLPAAAVPEPEAAAGVLRTHWFCDGGVTSNVPITFFDALLPRWPTFGLTVAPVPDDAPDAWVHVPPQDASVSRPTWRDILSPSAFLGALVGAGLDWRDTVQAELPGFRGRVASVRHSPGESASPLFLPQRDILHLALRGYHGAVALRERFTGRDGDVAGQTQTDRHRWIRLRMAVREIRRLSLDTGARLPLYADLASGYRVPRDVADWFDEPPTPGERDPAWTDTATAITTFRVMSTGGVLDFDAEDGTPPLRSQLRLSAPD